MSTKNIFIAGVTPVEDDFCLSDFTHIRAYHGCRPIDPESYKEHGIRSITYQGIKQEMLLRLQNTRVPKEELLKAFDEHWKTLTDIHMGVWFTLTREELINESGHYLISGSEFLLAFATSLFLQYELRKTGIPTIFHCDVPVELIHPVWIDSMEQGILDGRLSPCGFKISTTLLPELIVKAEHPRKIIDQHHGGCVYRPDC